MTMQSYSLSFTTYEQFAETLRTSCEQPVPRAQIPRSTVGWGGLSTAGDDLDDFQPVTGRYHAPRKFGRNNRIAIVLNNDASRQQLLPDQELLHRTRQSRGHLPSICNHPILGAHCTNPLPFISTTDEHG